jgi:hypothetical protein
LEKLQLLAAAFEFADDQVPSIFIYGKQVDTVVHHAGQYFPGNDLQLLPKFFTERVGAVEYVLLEIRTLQNIGRYKRLAWPKGSIVCSLSIF